MWGAALLVASLSTVLASSPPLVVVSVGGLRHDYLDDQRMPNLAAAMKQGVVVVKGVHGDVMGRTVSELHSVATGEHPAVHGVVGDRMLVDGEVFTPTSTGAKWWGTKTIWDNAKNHAMKTAVFGWPSQSASAATYSATGTATQAVGKVEEWLKSDASTRPHLVMVHMGEVEKMALADGPLAITTLEAVHAVDVEINKLWTIVESVKGNLMVLATHGTEVASKGVVVLEDTIDVTNLEVGDVGPQAALYPKNVADVAGIVSKLEKVANIKVYSGDARPATLQHKHTAPILVVADKGYQVKVRTTDVLEHPKGGQGYVSGVSGVLFGAGPSFRRGVVLPDATVTVQDIYPLLCKLVLLPIEGSAGRAWATSDMLEPSTLRAHWVIEDKSARWQQTREDLQVAPMDRAMLFEGMTFDVSVDIPVGLPGANAEEASVVVEAGGKMVQVTDMCREAKTTFTTPTHKTHIWRSCTTPAGVKGAAAVKVTSGKRTRSVTWMVKSFMGGSEKARNVVLLIGDGMSLPMLTAGRMMTVGRDASRTYPTDGFSHIGLAKTYSYDSSVTDSASSASALLTGHKTHNGATGVYPDSTQNGWDGGDFTNDLDNPKVETGPEYLKRTRRTRIGVVTTASAVDATPAAVWGHCSRRTLETQLAVQAFDLKPEVILGGGKRAFDGSRFEADGKPPGGENVLKKFNDTGYTIVENRKQLQDAMADKTKVPERLLGLFTSKHMDVNIDRLHGDAGDQPSLPEMTLAALDVLRPGGKKEGFMLVVEGASIDKQAHACDTARMLGDLLEFQDTVKKVREWLKEAGLEDETLVVVTSDHATGGFDVYGTADTDHMRRGGTDEELRRGLHDYGLSDWTDWTDKDGDGYVDNWFTAKRTFAAMNNNHPTYREDFTVKPNAGWLYNATALSLLKGLYMPSNLPLADHHTADERIGVDSAVHTASDVMVFATGPGSSFFGRVLDNVEIFEGMMVALHGESQSPPTSPQTDKKRLCEGEDDDDDNKTAVIVLSVFVGLLGLYSIAMTVLYVKAAGASAPKQNAPDSDA